MRLLLDEMYPPRPADEMRKRGHDIVAVAERPDLRSSDDQDLLLAATEDDRVLVTEDVVDFLEITHLFATDEREHRGVILVSSRTFPRTERGLGALTRALDGYLRHHSSERAVPGGIHWLTPER